MTIEKTLLISGEETVLHSLKEGLPSEDMDISVASSGLKAVDLLKQTHFDLIFCDYSLPDISGIDVLQIAKQLIPHLLFILLITPTQIEKVLGAIRLGAFQYLIKPLEITPIEAIWEKALEHTTLLQENEFLRKEMSYSPKVHRLPLIAESPVMKLILESVDKIAKSNASVFISGESGTGKEVIASAIHNLSFRSHKPFIRVNCAAIPATLLESEFFGHEKGSFTGAMQKRLGRFELSDRGTLLLDEISEIPLELQPKLLRVIQEQEFERLGGSKPIKVDVRLISTSNRNMKQTIEEKLFREDLYFRLNVVPLRIPPLRERKEDIIPLAEYFLEKLCKDNFKPLKHLSSSAKEKLLDYYWPGNVRELSNIIERTIVMCSSDLIESDDLTLEFSCPVPPPAPQFKLNQSNQTLASMEKMHILATLQMLGNNKTKAAESLGISIRTLRNKLKEFSLESS